MKDEYIRSSRPYFPKEDIAKILLDIKEVLEDGRLRNGKNLQAFEHMFAEYIGVKHAVAFDSDGDALETALRHYGAEGKEVVVCTNSFISIPNSIRYAEGKVVFADIRAETLSMSPDSLRKRITKKTAGVIVTHIAGFPNPDLKEIMEICEERDLFLIEDATHAVGALFEGKKVGTFGRAAVFAFTPTKVLTTGEGGMLITNDADLAEEAKRFRYYGSGSEKSSFVKIGRHMLLPEISAILGIYQLKRVEEFISKRNEIAKTYNTLFEKLDYVRTVKCPPRGRCSYYKYPLILHNKVNRAEFIASLKKEYGIETGNVFYPPCHMQPAYASLQASNNSELSVSASILHQTITLPMHAAMTIKDASYVAEAVSTLVSRLCKC